MRELDGMTRTCGLIGNPVEHTVSPVIHNTLAEATGMDLVYVPFHVQTGYLEQAVKGAYALNLLGLNVTVPYKSDVISFLQDIDPLAEKIGAVNTLVRMDGGYKGYNTDMPGLYRAMCSDGVQIEGEHVLILGAGGVARAVAVLMAEKNAERIYILNRTLERARQVSEEVNGLAGREVVYPMELCAYQDLPKDRKYLCVQATNVGMYPKIAEAPIEDEAFYQLVHTGYDLIFNPLDNRFMQLVRQGGGSAYNGLKMLLYQGIIAYELWTGKAVAEHLAEEVLGKMLTAMKQKK